MCRGCSALFSAVTGIQKLDLSDTVVRDDGMRAVAQLSNLNNLNLAYSGIFAAIWSLRLSSAGAVSAGQPHKSVCSDCCCLLSQQPLRYCTATLQE